MGIRAHCIPWWCRCFYRKRHSGFQKYDLAKVGDSLAVEHYKTLEKNASDCISCGHCNSRCPFGVDQISRMKEIANFMV
ncbi:MAG: hypothetical protein E7302_17675 [Butyrivibrio sp.]|nr:hypothetical protein [Butyrivibrio sp.]